MFDPVGVRTASPRESDDLPFSGRLEVIDQVPTDHASGSDHECHFVVLHHFSLPLVYRDVAI